MKKQKLSNLRLLGRLFAVVAAGFFWRGIETSSNESPVIWIIIGIIFFLIGYILLVKEYKLSKFNHKKDSLKKYFFNFSIFEIFFYIFVLFIINNLLSRF